MSLLNPEILHRIIFCWYKYQTEFLAVCQVQNCLHWWGPRHYVCELPSAKFHLWNSHTLGFARTHLHTHVCGIKALASTPPPSCHSNAQTANLPRSIEPIRAFQEREPYLALLFFNGWHTIVQFYPYKTSVNYSKQGGLKIYLKNNQSCLFAIASKRSDFPSFFNLLVVC